MGRKGDVIYRWRIIVIVLGSLFVLFLGFGVVPIHGWTDDAELTIRIVTGFAVALTLIGTVRFNRPGPAWPDERRRRVVKASVLAQVAVANRISIWATDSSDSTA